VIHAAFRCTNHLFFLGFFSFFHIIFVY
jgi:hypothetical protein